MREWKGIDEASKGVKERKDGEKLKVNYKVGSLLPFNYLSEGRV